jgi:DHA2 family multidrug resistance protein
MIDVRWLVAFGIALFAVSNFMNIYINPDVAGDQLLWPNIVRAVGQALVLAPLGAIATAGIERENAGSASSLFNMMRNLGGAIGIAALQTFVTKREQFHSNVLSDSVSVFDDATRARLAQLTHYFLSHGVADPAQAWRKAVVAVGRDVRRQAFLMGYGDTFFLLGIVLTVAVVAVLLLRKADRPAAGAAH